MVNQFKFLQKKKIVRKSVSYLKLKNEFNRNKIITFLWSEYPEYPHDSNLLEFNGNILDFYNMLGGPLYSSLTIYEMAIKETGYFDSCIVFNIRHVLSKFIRRKAKLKIIYSL
jgi:hypothetical protein